MRRIEAITLSTSAKRVSKAGTARTWGSFSYTISCSITWSPTLWIRILPAKVTGGGYQQ